MVERLRQAIEKARRERLTRGDDAPEKAERPSAKHPIDNDAVWRSLRTVSAPDAALSKARIVTIDKRDPAHTHFDMLRTRLLRLCRDRGWRRIGITSPSDNCGKSFISANLAFSVARNTALRCVLVDCDLKRPSIRSLLELPPAGHLAELLRGAATLEETALRLQPNLAVICGAPTRDSAELFQSPDTVEAMAGINSNLEPDLVICDMPPMFAGDDVLSLLGHLDACLVVASAGKTTAKAVIEAERTLGDATGFLGVVLNRTHQSDVDMNTYYARYDDESVA